MADNETWIPNRDKYSDTSENLSDKCLDWYMTSANRHDRDPSILQYCNFKHVKQMFLSNELVLRSLDPDKRHINIGTGAGFMEYTNNKYLSYKLDTVDLAQGTIDPVFQLCKGILNVKQDYIMRTWRSKNGDDFVITDLDPFNNFTRWDNAIFNRFVPLKDLNSIENVKKFNKHMKKYVDRITIVTISGDKGSYPAKDLFPDANITEIGTALPEHFLSSMRTLIEYDI
mgnify:FL=1